MSFSQHLVLWLHVAFVAVLLDGHKNGTIALSAFEKEFCESMSNWSRKPTEKQQAVLDRMEKKYPLGASSHVNIGSGAHLAGMVPYSARQPVPDVPYWIARGYSLGDKVMWQGDVYVILPHGPTGQGAVVPAPRALCP